MKYTIDNRKDILYFLTDDNKIIKDPLDREQYTLFLLSIIQPSHTVFPLPIL